MSTAPQRQEKTVSEDRNIAVSFSGKLDSGELLTGTPTITDVSGNSPGLTISNQAINTTELTINKVVTPIGEAIQFNVTGGAVGKYTIRISCGTDATPSQTLYGSIVLNVVAD